MITRFTGEYAFLSNFHPSPMKIDGLHYPTVEHYFQSMKAKKKQQAKEIRKAATPKEAKRLGARCTMRGDWNYYRLEVMRTALDHKFPGMSEKPHDLSTKLVLNTLDYGLIEGNTWGDKFWGMTWNNTKMRWEGLNWLGTLLMARRAELTDLEWR